MKTLRELYLQGRALLQDSGMPELEAKQLLLSSGGIGEAYFYAHPEKTLSRSQVRLYLRLIARRRAGWPLAYLTGEKEFWSLVFKIFPGIPIPRPETELVVEKALEKSSRGKESIVDIGTGCGNIAVALSRELPLAHIVATDTSRKALKTARLNAAFHGTSAITFISGSLLRPLKALHLEGRCDMIVSNPPYVSEEQWARLDPQIRDHEPKRAMVAGETGLETIRRLVAGAPLYLKPGGHLVFEIDRGQKTPVLGLFDTGWDRVECFDDLSGAPRVITARKT